MPEEPDSGQKNLVQFICGPICFSDDLLTKNAKPVIPICLVMGMKAFQSLYSFPPRHPFQRYLHTKGPGYNTFLAMETPSQR